MSESASEIEISTEVSGSRQERDVMFDRFSACYDIKGRGVGVLKLKRAFNHQPFRAAMKDVAARYRNLKI